jgi:hypothetical protein
MKRILIGIALLACLTSSYAHAVTYTYTGQNYTTANGMYMPAMRVTGTFTTSTPVPPNSTDYDISGILTSWSFNDGVQTIDNMNGVFHPNPLFPPLVTTDASGNITSTSLFFHRVPIATVLGVEDDFIWIGSFRATATIDAPCVVVTDGYCDGWGIPADWAQSSVTGVWVTSDLPSKPIPTMSQWSLMLLALLLGMVGITRIRRQV